MYGVAVMDIFSIRNTIFRLQTTTVHNPIRYVKPALAGGVYPDCLGIGPDLGVILTLDLN